MRIGGMLAALAAVVVLGCSHGSIASDPATSIAAADAQSGSPEQAAVLRARSLLPQVAKSFNETEVEVSRVLLDAQREMRAFGVDESAVKLLAMVNTSGLGGIPGDFQMCLAAYVKLRRTGYDHERAARGYPEGFRLSERTPENQARAENYLRTGKL